ncbi:PIAP-like protein [Mya arenaria]|uniref:PIAP-like protein n=1 Tax=Mya arenaria TaxID=6604 RepID=A0ABY7EI53_MYAAR|nr:PIAP-like protein [Mya arenaria]
MQDLEPGAIRQKQLAEFRERSLQGPPPRQYRIRNEAYNTYELRLTSFEKWPEHIVQRPPILAEAGLYYTGIDDHVRCFACDGGLRRWDPEDDPWIEHCRWFPACPFARKQKGDEFIALVQASADQNIDELGATSGNFTNDYVGGVNNLHITDPDIKRSIEEKRKICTDDMGFSNEVFSFAVSELRQQEELLEENKRLKDMLTCFICQNNPVYY